MSKKIAQRVADKLNGIKLVKSDRPLAGQYVHREIHFNKGVAGGWYVRAVPMNMSFPIGVTAKTARELMIKINEILDKKK